MDIIAIILVAFGLAMDSFAVSISRGLAIKQLKINNAIKIALCFGLFQAIMPVIGWLAGMTLKEFITGIDHWIVFGLLSFIGIKMIYESTRTQQIEKKIDPLNIYLLLMLGVATSIDALAVGLSFAFLQISIIAPIIIIGVITFLLSFIGVYIGNRFGHMFENKIEILGGLILIGIGIKVLIEHLFII